MIFYTLPAVLLMLMSTFAWADSSSPQLAAYYNRQMAIVNETVYAWQGRNAPSVVPLSARQVGVGRDRYYVLTMNGELVAFRKPAGPRTMLMRGVTQFSAGNSGVLAIRDDQALWWISGKNKKHLADDAAAVAVGDGANYYITGSGKLYVRGLAHRGQYGDGRLKATPHFIQTASGARQVVAHTGHALMLTVDGDVFGTGGNIYGPVGKHGLGDKAVRWSRITTGAKAIATGSSHSLAIRRDGALMVWGSGYGTMPTVVLSDIVAVAAGSRTTIALNKNDVLWQWDGTEKPTRVALPAGK